MPIRIAFPEKHYFKPLIDNVSKVISDYDTNIEFVNEEKAMKMLDSGEVELAFLNPLTYGNLTSLENFSILPTTCLSAANYSNLEKIYLNDNLKVIETFGIHSDTFFLEYITKIILIEKFDFDIKAEYYDDIAEYNLFKFDAFLSEENISTLKSLDLTEEWFDSFEFELPLGFWVAKKNADTEKLKEITFKLATNDLENVRVYEEVHNGDLEYEREGFIKYRFDAQTEKAIDEILELFYEMGLMEEMKDSKVISI
jgi:hypothetical protein